MLTIVNAVLLTATTDEEGRPVWMEGWLRIGEDGRIAGLGEGTPPPGPGERLDVGQAFVAPGFVSAHSHLFTSGMRGVAPDSTLYEWVSRNSQMLVGAEPDDLYWMTAHGALDVLSHGVTSVFNFLQSRVVSTFDWSSSTLKAARVHGPDFLTRQVDAARDAGLRTVTAVRLDDEQLPEEESFAAFAHVMAHRAGAEPGSARLDLGGAVYGAVQWSSSPVTAERERAVMTEHGVANQAHFVETAEQIDLQRSRFSWYEEAGVLGPDMVFGHFVHPTDHMVEALAAADSPVSWQPTSNGRLGSGSMDAVRLRDAGIRIGLGLDDQSCTDVSDPFQNMRFGLYQQRAQGLRADTMSPHEVFRAHTLGAADVIGVADRVGSLEVGKEADLVVVDPRRPDLGPVWDPVATYVLACQPRHIRQVFVGGERVWDAEAEPGALSVRADAETYERMVRSAAASGFAPAVTRKG